VVARFTKRSFCLLIVEIHDESFPSPTTPSANITAEGRESTAIRRQFTRTKSGERSCSSSQTKSGGIQRITGKHQGISPHFSYRFCCELPPAAPCGLRRPAGCSASRLFAFVFTPATFGSASLRLLRPAPASFRPEFPLDSMFSYSSAGTARREIRSAPYGHGSSPRLATKRYEKSGLGATSRAHGIPTETPSERATGLG
jgi:hypothetical protein